MESCSTSQRLSKQRSESPSLIPSPRSLHLTFSNILTRILHFAFNLNIIHTLCLVPYLTFILYLTLFHTLILILVLVFYLILIPVLVLSLTLNLVLVFYLPLIHVLPLTLPHPGALLLLLLSPA